MFELWDVLESLGHFDGIVPSLTCILTKQHGVHSGKYLLKNPGNTISETWIFKMFLASSALKNLCLWCKFQSLPLFIISLLLKNFLTALCIISGGLLAQKEGQESGKVSTSLHEIMKIRVSQDTGKMPYANAINVDNNTNVTCLYCSGM